MFLDAGQVNKLRIAIQRNAGVDLAVTVPANTNTSILTGAISTFNNANGVTFGSVGNVVTASVQTNYQSTGNYLTTAMASDNGSNFVQAGAVFFGTNASGTIASNAISVSVLPPGAGGSILFSAGTLSALRTDITFDNANGVTFGLETNGVITATVSTNYQSQGAYLTTAALSQDSSKYAGTNGAITGGSITVNTSGVSVNLPAYLTTAALSQDSSKYAGTSTGMAGGSVTLNTSGISISLPAYLTTAAQSGATSNYAGVGETTTTQAGTALGLTVNTAGVNIAYPNWLTTAALSQDSSNYAGVGETTSTQAGTALGLTVNTAGVNIAYANWLTTAMASNRGSDFVQATAAFAGTNASGTINSTGISVSVAAPGGGATASLWPDYLLIPDVTTVSTYYSGSRTNGGGGGTTNSSYTFSIYLVPMVLPVAVAFSHMRLLMSNVTAVGTGSATHVYSAGFYTNNASTLSLVKGYYGGIVLSQNSSNNWTFSVWTASTAGASSDAAGFAGISKASIQSSQGNVNSSLMINGSSKWVRVDSGVMTTLSAGQYWFAYANAWISSGANVLSLAGVAQAPAVTQMQSGFLDAGVNTSATLPMYGSGWGAIQTTFSSASNAASFWPLPNAIALTDISVSSTAVQRNHFPLLRGI